ncbi:MAG: AAA family ATPase [Anaerococcus sp.]|uniref:ATP-binding protein n=1 Tax=Anaerococcus sp. TaxID=1872515 RepID=UPI00291470B5|nr:AAA family ATPase [Anaerococcus sp.]MDU7411322.1 AAA family ATPase [Anaerococcus sp.]
MTVLLKKINIISFGQFENTSINFEDGFNLIYGKNESGKSTIASFIEGILYGFDDGNRVRHFNRKQEIYRPINSYKYAGMAIFNKDGIDYRISRNFDNGEYEIYDLKDNKIMDAKASNLNFPGEFILGISYDIYKSIISNYQSQESSEKAKAKVIELLINRDDYNFSSSDAINILDNKLAEIGSDRAYTKPYAKTKAEIDDISREILDLKTLRNQTNRDFEKLYKNRDQLAKKSKKVKELKKSRDAYRGNVAYKNLEDEIKYKNQLNFIESELKKYEDIASIKYKKDTDLLDKTEDLSDKNLLKHYIIYICGSLLLILMWKYFKQNYLLAIAIILPIIMIAIDKKDSKVSDDHDKKYNDERYIKYLRLVKEREKIEEVLRVLENQDKTKDRSNIKEIQNLDIKETEEKIRKLEIDLEDLNKTNINLERKLASSEEKLNHEVDLVDRLNILEQNLIAMEEEIQAIKLAKDTIAEIRKDITENNANFDREISDLIATITKDKYKKVSYDTNLNPSIINSNGESISIDKLSTGFYDQLNFALKFLINDNKLDDFIIFDDAFINYDLDRLRLALFFLLDLANDRQIIYMTCHNREEEVLKSEAIDFNMIDLEEI